MQGGPRPVNTPQPPPEQYRFQMPRWEVSGGGKIELGLEE